ncbi:hypothetical protein ACFL0S_10900 [Thermodesulfobacteriota bacterium]
MIPEPSQKRLAQISKLPADWKEQIEKRERAAGINPSTVQHDEALVFLGTDDEFNSVIKKYGWSI